MVEKESRLLGISCEDFYMYKYKVETCQKRYAHDWTSCLYAHSGESARRRDPSVYKPIPCPESKGGNPCPRGDSCKYAHNDFEYWLHPARYKTEYCKQGPSCGRKICFFAHRPEEIRKAPSVVYTNQGPFLDSETTARNKQRQICGTMPQITSPWMLLANRNSGNFNNNINLFQGDMSGIPENTGYLSSTEIGALSPPVTLVNSHSTQPLLYNCTNSLGLQGYEDLQECSTGSFSNNNNCGNSSQNLFSDLSRQNEDAQSLNNLQCAINALSLTSPNLHRSINDLSPLASQTPTTPWSATTNHCSYGNPFGAMCAERLGNTDLLAYLQGVKNHQSLTQTPRSFTDELARSETFPYSWSNDLIDIAQIVSTEMKGDPVLSSSISDRVAYGHTSHMPPLFNPSNTTTTTTATATATAAIASTLGNSKS